MTITATPAAEAALPDTIDDDRLAELMAIIPTLSGRHQRPLYLLGLAFVLEKEGKNTSSGRLVRDRLAAIETAWGFTLRGERGRARLGALTQEDSRL